MTSFREYIRDRDDPKVKGIEQYDAYTWAEKCLANPRVSSLFATWRDRLENESFTGISSDTNIRRNLFELTDDDAPIADIKRAISSLLAILNKDETRTLNHPIDARARHAWMNPEVYMNRFGLRLDELSTDKQAAIMNVLSASLSRRGYQKVANLLEINHFLGEVVGAPKIMNRYSYNFNLFGDPLQDEVWGWSFYGHHVCLNCTVVRKSMVLTPVFFGAEPAYIDAGEHAGLAELQSEGRIALELMRSFPAEVARRAQLFSSKRGEDLPPGRNVIADELLLAGAFQDNRTIPFEGVRATDLPGTARDLLTSLISTYLEYLPSGPFERRMAEVKQHLDETFFCWIGGTGDEDPFYYRIQSPVLLIEFDHHAGVFLSNTEPKKFHIHTLVRTPNGNDYGIALARRCCAGNFENYKERDEI